jgi:BirA family biotin operon repressor/biotin-[acetyl-CoA-carboxylase] ligase
MTDAPPLRPSLDKDRLAASAPGSFTVEVLDSAPSTNAVLAERARGGAADGLVVVAEHQTSGRGRLDRSWETPARSALTVSVLVRPDSHPDRWPWLPLLTGLAAHGALPEGAALKWPNDVLLGHLKVAGILVELVETPTGPAAVLGIGINVGMTEDELPVPTATSLAVAGHDVDRTELLLRFLRELERELSRWARGRDADPDLRAAYVERCMTIGRDVEVALPSGETIAGRALDVDEGGRLVVQTETGTTAVGAGDVVHVRPAG